MAVSNFLPIVCVASPSGYAELWPYQNQVLRLAQDERGAMVIVLYDYFFDI